MSTKTKHIEVVPYNPNWPKMFEIEAATLKDALGDNCSAIHHIGSTSVPELSAKKDIDILCIVDKLALAQVPLQAAGYVFKGELNIPFRYFFSKNTEHSKVNLHVVEADHGFISLNLCFRDYLRANDESRLAYENLKKELIKDPKSHQRTASRFPEYTLGKYQFIKDILDKAEFTGITINFCLHDTEWNAARQFRQAYFFDKVPVTDPYTWTFNHPDHVHFVLYQGTEIIGYAHIQLWPEKRAALRIIVVEPLSRNQGFGGRFLGLIEKWLKTQGYKSIHTESSPDAFSFYKKYGYTDMPFNDPDNYESDPQDIPMGKTLIRG